MKIPEREEGQGLVEYALLLVLVAVVIIGILTVLGSSVLIVYAKVIAGLHGQVITGQGTEVVVTGFDANVSAGAGGCVGTVRNISFIGLHDGALLESGSVSINFYINGSLVNTVNGTTDSSGSGELAGPVPVGGGSAGSSCNVEVRGG